MSRAREEKQRPKPPTQGGGESAPATAATALVVGYIEQRAREGQADQGASPIVEELLRRMTGILATGTILLSLRDQTARR